MVGSLFGNQEERIRQIVEKIIFTKTLDWEYEGEYRIAVPLRQDEEPWDTVKFHAEEITELYLGLAMRLDDMVEVIKLARAINPGIALFQAERTNDGGLSFRRLPQVGS